MANVSKQDLEKYIHAKREVTLLAEDLKSNAQAASDTVTGSMSQHPFTERRFTVIGTNERQLKRLKARLTKKEAFCEKVEEAVDGIEDSEMHTLIRFRFLKGMNWPTVIRKTGCRLSPDAARKKVDKFLKNF